MNVCVGGIYSNYVTKEQRISVRVPTVVSCEMYITRGLESLSVSKSMDAIMVIIKKDCRCLLNLCEKD